MKESTASRLYKLAQRLEADGLYVDANICMAAHEQLVGEDAVATLRAAAVPTQGAWAKEKKLVPSYVSDVLNGRRDPSPAILGALGLERVVTYRRKRNSTTHNAEHEDQSR